MTHQSPQERPVNIQYGYHNEELDTILSYNTTPYIEALEACLNIDNEYIISHGTRFVRVNDNRWVCVMNKFTDNGKYLVDFCFHLDLRNNTDLLIATEKVQTTLQSLDDIYVDLISAIKQ